MKRGMRLFLTTIIIAICATLILFGGTIDKQIGVSAAHFSKTGASGSNRQKSATEIPAQKKTPLLGGTSTTFYNGYTAHVFTDTYGNSLRYYLYVPDNYNPAQKYPLVLLLHGGGERGSPKNTLAQNEHVLLDDPYALVWSTAYKAPENPHIQEHWPCFVVVPQLNTGQNWVNVPVHNGSYIQPTQPSVGLLAAKEILDTLQKEYVGIDSHRLYITGLSLGGLGTWDAVERWPHYFAAAVPIAGAGDPSKAADLKDLPIWAFHGSADTSVPVTGSRAMIAAIRAAGGNPSYTEFSNQGHGIWGWVYGFNEGPLLVTNFYPWLFSQHT